MKFRPSAIITPHSGVGGCTPRPKKPSEAPARMSRTKSLIAEDERGSDHVRQQVAKHDAQVAVAEARGPRGCTRAAGAEGLAADDPRVGDPADQRDRDVEVASGRGRASRRSRAPARGKGTPSPRRHAGRGSSPASPRSTRRTAPRTAPMISGMITPIVPIWRSVRAAKRRASEMSRPSWSVPNQCVALGG